MSKPVDVITIGPSNRVFEGLRQERYRAAQAAEANAELDAAVRDEPALARTVAVQEAITGFRAGLRVAPALASTPPWP